MKPSSTQDLQNQKQTVKFNLLKQVEFLKTQLGLPHGIHHYAMSGEKTCNPPPPQLCTVDITRAYASLY